jgi:hypothetical protein
MHEDVEVALQARTFRPSGVARSPKREDRVVNLANATGDYTPRYEGPNAVQAFLPNR